MASETYWDRQLSRCLLVNDLEGIHYIADFNITHPTGS
jgi:hypothetical protein